MTNWEWSRWSPFALTFLYLYGAHAVVFNVFSHFLSEKVSFSLKNRNELSAICPRLHVIRHFWLRLLLYPFPGGIIYRSRDTDLRLCPVLQVSFILCKNMAKTRNKWAVWASSLPLLYVMMNHNEKLADDPFLIYTFLAYS